MRDQGTGDHYSLLELFSQSKGPLALSRSLYIHTCAKLKTEPEPRITAAVTDRSAEGPFVGTRRLSFAYGVRVVREALGRAPSGNGLKNLTRVTP